MENVLKIGGDRRTQRSCAALVSAFIDLVLERPYSAIRIGDIADRANVGRSTCYAHFRNKDELLIASMGWMFDILAHAAVSAGSPQDVRELVDHFWSNRRLAQAVLAPALERKIRRALTEVIIRKMAETGAADDELAKLAAPAIAAGQLGILEAWTKGDFAAPPQRVAGMILALAGARPAALVG